MATQPDPDSTIWRNYLDEVASRFYYYWQLFHTEHCAKFFVKERIRVGWFPAPKGAQSLVVVCCNDDSFWHMANGLAFIPAIVQLMLGSCDGVGRAVVIHKGAEQLVKELDLSPFWRCQQHG